MERKICYAQWQGVFNVNTSSFFQDAVDFGQIVEMFRTPFRDTESSEEFANKLKTLRYDMKQKEILEQKEFLDTDEKNRLDHYEREIQNISAYLFRKKNNPGCFFAGLFRENETRGDKAVVFRSMISLDLDHHMNSKTFDVLIQRMNRAGCNYLIHSTRTSTKDDPRFRIYIPLAENLYTDDDDGNPTGKLLYKQAAETFVRKYGLEQWIDESSYKLSQVMFKPGISRDGDADYLFHAETERGFLNLAELDPALLSVEKVVDRKKEAKKLKNRSNTGEYSDPRNNTGIDEVRWFCRTYSITDVLEQFIPDVYSPSDRNPHSNAMAYYYYTAGSTRDGLVVYEGNYACFSHHDSDPAGDGHVKNAYDLVLIHCFKGDYEKFNSQIHQQESWKAGVLAGEYMPTTEKTKKKEERLAREREDLLDLLNDFAPVPNSGNGEIPMQQGIQTAQTTPIQAAEQMTDNNPANDQANNPNSQTGLIPMPFKSVARTARDLQQSFLNAVMVEPFVPISTGFDTVDFALDGGLYAGAYFLGAVSSLGKTTFLLQMADQIAESGQDVLFFSLEMSADELIAKSISRTSAQILMRENTKADNPIEKGLAMNRILKGITFEISPGWHDLFLRAQKEYFDKVGDHLSIVYSDNEFTIADVIREVRHHIEQRGQKPVVMIDYLQILFPEPGLERLTDKQLTDRNVRLARKISKRFEIPVIAISSFNRANYLEPVKTESFKESGSIEYSADVLMGLQFKGMEYDEQIGLSQDGLPVKVREKEQEHHARVAGLIDFHKGEAREGRGYPVELKILKNRRYFTTRTDLYLYPKFNLITEKPIIEIREPEKVTTDQRRKTKQPEGKTGQKGKTNYKEYNPDEFTNL